MTTRPLPAFARERLCEPEGFGARLHLIGFVLLVERPYALIAVGHLVPALVAIGIVAAAGSPVVEPRPLGAPLCAYAEAPESASAAASEIAVNFMAFPFG
jgi:hypothetical protein